jgi:hypothetical protein
MVEERERKNDSYETTARNKVEEEEEKKKKKKKKTTKNMKKINVKYELTTNLQRGGRNCGI